MTEEYRYPSLLLMETAGRKAAEFMLSTFPSISKFLLLCGKGNNGGDGFVIARYLKQAGKQVWIIHAFEPETFSENARINYHIVEHEGVKLSLYADELVNEIQTYLQEGSIIVDALLGTGARQKLLEPLAGMINRMRTFPNPVVAIDLPSGLVGDTGSLVNRPLKCQYTLSFQLPKVCHYVTPAANFCGTIEVLDINIYPTAIERPGIKYQAVNAELIKSWYKKREPDAHKGDFGHVLLAGGSKGKAGAIALSASAANEIGAGLCTAFIPGSASCSFHRTTLENMYISYGANSTAYLNETSADVFASFLEGKSVAAIGPGLGNTLDTFDFLRTVLPQVTIPMVLDADALNIIAEHGELWDLLPRVDKSDIVLTPHPGEMARLMGVAADVIQERRFEYALQLAKERKVIVVLKGAGTIVAAPTGHAYLCNAGNPGMASGGVGDVLTGIIAGLIAQGYNAFKAAAMAVYIHAHSADMVHNQYGPEGVTATKIIRNLGMSLQAVLKSAGL